MLDISDKKIEDLISIDTFNDTSLFAVSVVDLSSYEVIYANQAMKNIMADMTAKNCWEAMHGQESPCMWCKAPKLLANLEKKESIAETKTNDNYAIYEHFNETANKWYQVQEKVVALNESKNVLISFALDISIQKEAQSQLIETHVKLSRQTEALREAKKALQEQANRDPLTNLYNRRYFIEMSHKIIALSKREKQPLSVIMLDIDKFKNVNDTYGHQTGDEVIISLANQLMSLLRESDVLARFGGEEFAVLLPNTDLKNALLLTENIRKHIEESELEQCSLDDKKEIVKFTISAGVYEFNAQEDNSITSPLNKADLALYEAKESGRNRVCAFEE